MHELHSTAFKIWRGGSTPKLRVWWFYYIFFRHAIKCLNRKHAVNPESHQYGMPVAKITLHFLNASVCFVPILAPLFLQRCGCPVPVTTQPAFIPCFLLHGGTRWRQPMPVLAQALRS